MFPEKLPDPAAAELKTYPLGEKTEPSTGPTPYIPAVIALSHTNLEQRLYSAMLAASTNGSNGHHFTARQLLERVMEQLAAAFGATMVEGKAA